MTSNWTNGISSRASKALISLGCKSKNDVINFSDIDLLKHPAIGRKTLLEINAWIGRTECHDNINDWTAGLDGIIKSALLRAGYTNKEDVYNDVINNNIKIKKLDNVGKKRILILMEWLNIPIKQDLNIKKINESILFLEKNGYVVTKTQEK